MKNSTDVKDATDDIVVDETVSAGEESHAPRDVFEARAHEASDVIDADGGELGCPVAGEVTAIYHSCPKCGSTVPRKGEQR